METNSLGNNFDNSVVDTNKHMRASCVQRQKVSPGSIYTLLLCSRISLGKTKPVGAVHLIYCEMLLLVGITHTHIHTHMQSNWHTAQAFVSPRQNNARVRGEQMIAVSAFERTGKIKTKKKHNMLSKWNQPSQQRFDWQACKTVYNDCERRKQESSPGLSQSGEKTMWSGSRRPAV